MSATYNPDSPDSRGQVRLLASDTDVADPFFQDGEIDVFLALEGANVRRAAALALETIAAQQTLLLKKLTLLNQVSTDGPAVAKALRERAAELRRAATEAEARDGAVFDVAEMALDESSYAEIVYSAALRGA